MQSFCQKGAIFPYPFNGMIVPWLRHYYQWNRTWTDPTPDGFGMYGSIKCRGYRIASKKLLGLPYGSSVVAVRKIESIFCLASRLPEDTLTETESALQYPVNCWNDARTFNNRSYGFYDICKGLHECISQYRITDGHQDCGDAKDENSEVVKPTNYCFNLRKHRFQCSVVEMNCLATSSLGKTISYCQNKNDMFVADSICRPGQRGLIKNSDNPLCICSLDHFGPSCHIRNEACKSDPCGMNGTCHLTYDPSGDKPIVCQCSKQFYGDRCQYEKVVCRSVLRLGSAFMVYNQTTTSDDHYWTAANHSLLS
ncbi:unnamed protein product [Adineta steineri]|uniref:EGF-like domain-containing protein n=1 Tax=Adineta steineri TaxID=433720 RepID=A0A819DGC8_9BILA|nr:unnamed protein product [Adineta steineri]